MPESNEKPVFGYPPERRVVPKTNVKGQRKIGLERQLPPATPIEPSKDVVKRRRHLQALKFEKQKTEWDEFILNRGTRDEIRMKGRYYEIAKDLPMDSLGIFNTPPRGGQAVRLDSLRGGETVFVVKDSEKAVDRFKKGWAEIVVLDIGQAGEPPKVRLFNDGIRDGIMLCRALFQGIIDRQVIKQ